MKLFADTNWLAALYFSTEQTAVADRYMRRVQQPLYVSPPVWLEARNVFARLSRHSESAPWRAALSDLGGRLHLEKLEWLALVKAAEKLMDRFSASARLGTLDCLVVASAKL